MIATLLAHTLRALAWVGGLPGARWRNRIASVFARRELRRGSRDARVAACNLRLAGLDPGLLNAVLQNTALTFLESLRFWTRSRARNLGEIVGVEGLEHLEAAEANGAVIVVAPHQGNWELLVQWLAARRAFALLYTRGETPAVDRFLRIARERHGVRAVAADAHGMKPLLQVLRTGGSVGITPDQRPEGGRGLWSPFFGVPALTMTLIQRLQERSAARLVVAAAERRADGGFMIRITPLAETATTGPLPQRVDALNLAVESFVRRNPAQYQWIYKRFKGQLPGESLINPYWPECY